MKRTLLSFLVMLLVFGAQPATGGTILAAQTDADAQVRTAVADLDRFEQDGNMSAIYDRMAPDARNLIAREVWLAWTSLTPRLVPDAPAAIEEITFESWTWPVTGETFDNVAIVHLTQSGTVDGQSVTREQVLHFLDVEGQWRLLPLMSPWMAALAVDASNDPFAYTSPFDNAVYAAIDTFWAQNFAAAGLDYEPPRDVVSVTRNGQVSSGCGTKSDIDEYGIYYCTVDEAVYFSPEFEAQVTAVAGDYGWNNIIAHEWGHHIQDLLNLDYSSDPELDDGFYTIELELQADCLAGMFLQDQLARDAIGQPELDQALRITGAAGDAPDTTWDDPSAHGTGEQRQTSWQNGFDSGFAGCRLNLAA